MDKKTVLEKIKNQIIISSQAQSDEPFHNEIAMNAMIETVINMGKINALRLAGKRDIKNTKDKFKNKVVIIGITKPDKIPFNCKEIVYITPSVDDAKSIIDAGADIVAFDSTNRKSDSALREMINFIHSQNKIAMADISQLMEAKRAYEFGVDIISTTLSGYTKETENNPCTPDFELLQKCALNFNIPVILEGKIWDKNDVKKAFSLGAYSVVIGSAVTRPHNIIAKFKEGLI